MKLAFGTAAVAAEDGVELTVTAKSYVRDLFCMADKVDVTASVAEGMVSLLPGESIVLHIATGNVDAMLLVNVELGDPCVALLEEHEEMPVLAIADASVVGNLPSLSSADADAVRQAVRYLYDLGHRQIARVGGPESLAHSYIRDSAFADVASELGMRYRCLHTDYTPETGREATKRLLAFSEHPTAIIYDNDVMALAGLGVAASQGIKVPEEISIMSWDDSLMCTAAYPNLTAMGRDVVDTGKQAAGLLLKLIGGERVGHLMEGPYELRARASTGPAPAAE
nr:substrate-binding domain-containing protein [Bifidobacterium catenulatum]